MTRSDSTAAQREATSKLGAELRSTAELISLQIPLDPNDSGVSMAFYKLMPELGQILRLRRHGGLYGVQCNFYDVASYFTPEQGRMLWPHVVTAARQAKKLKASQAEYYCRQYFPSLWTLVENKPVPSAAPIAAEPPNQSVEGRLLRLEAKQSQHEQSLAEIIKFLQGR